MNSITQIPSLSPSNILAPVKEYHYPDKETYLAPYIDNQSECLENVKSSIGDLSIPDLFEKPFSGPAISPDTWSVIWRNIRKLGSYNPEKRHIHLFGNEPDEVPITLIHERYNAIHHLTKDAKGNHWRRFADTPLFYQELLAQLETYRFCRDVKPLLLPLFMELNKPQSFFYQTWRIFESWPAERVQELYWYIRNNPDKLNGPGILGQISRKLTLVIIPASRIHPAIVAILKKGPPVKPPKKYRCGCNA